MARKKLPVQPRASLAGAKGEKELAQEYKAQLYQLSQPEFVKILIILAQLPFSTTKELLALSGAARQGISANRVQIWLRRARSWGWLDFVNSYSSSDATVTGRLNPVATSGLSCLFYHPGSPLQEQAEQEYFESLAERTAPPSKRVKPRARHFYLTRKGASLLANLAVFYQPGNKRNKAKTASQVAASQKWQAEFVALFGFDKAAGEILPGLARLEGLRTMRQFLMVLADTCAKMTTTMPKNFEFSWQDNLNSLSAAYNGLLSERCIFNLVDGLLRMGNTHVLVLADTEQLSPGWIMNYLNQFYSLLQDAGTTRAIVNALASFHCGGVGLRVEEWLAALAAYKDKVTGGPFEKNWQEEASPPANPKLRVVVLTSSRTRAILWREANARTPSSNELALRLGELKFELEAIPAAEFEEKARNIFNSIEESGPGFVENKAFSGPALVGLVITSLGYYLKQLRTSSAGRAAPSSSSSASPSSFKVRACELAKLLPQTYQPFLREAGEIPIQSFEPELLLKLLEQPAKRRLLFTLHCYGLLDALSCCRLTGIEMTHLSLQLVQLEQLGLIARLWGQAAKQGRVWKQLNRTSPAEDVAPVTTRTSLTVSRYSFCSPSFQCTKDSTFPQLEVDKPKPGRRYQDYGSLSKWSGGDSTTRRYPFALERARLKRYYYFVSEKGLGALLWLEGFPLIFEPRYRGELSRLTRLRAELEMGQRKLVVLTEKAPPVDFTVGLEAELDFDLTGPDAKTEVRTGSQHHKLPAAGAKHYAGLSWPSLLVEHHSGLLNFFLSFDSAHFTQPFQTTPAIYPCLPKPINPTRLNDATTTAKSQALNLPARRSLFEVGSTVSLESWQIEPGCHRYYLLPEQVAVLGYDSSYATLPNLKTLASEAGGEKGECLPDGYGEITVMDPAAKRQRVIVYLEFERGQRNWLERYRAKLAAYVRLLWSEWLLQSIALGQPQRKLAPSVPRWLLLVSPNAASEAELGQLYHSCRELVLIKLLRQAHYRGYGPNGVSARAEAVASELLQQGLNIECFTTNENLLSSFGVFASIWHQL